MNLKSYLAPDFKFVEVRCEHRYCGAELSARGIGTTVGDGEVEEFDAAGYRGLWDDDLCVGESDNIWG